LGLAGDELEEEVDDDLDTPGKAKKGKRGAETAGRSPGKSKGKSLSASAKAALAASNKPPVSKFAALRHSAYKALFGWLDPKFERNGKKLLASSSVLWKFMVRMSSDDMPLRPQVACGTCQQRTVAGHEMDSNDVRQGHDTLDSAAQAGFTAATPVCK
jgi:hypothetical protein